MHSKQTNEKMFYFMYMNKNTKEIVYYINIIYIYIYKYIYLYIKLV